MRCACCGSELTEAAAREACASCLARNGCRLIRCPHCGYESAREPGVLSALRRIVHYVWWLVRGRRVSDSGVCLPAMPLCDLRKGEHAVIERFEELGHVRKFLSLGLLPGTSITMLKASPAVVVRAGYSEFAFDRTLAGTVMVRRLTARNR